MNHCLVRRYYRDYFFLVGTVKDLTDMCHSLYLPDGVERFVRDIVGTWNRLLPTTVNGRCPIIKVADQISIHCTVSHRPSCWTTSLSFRVCNLCYEI